MKPDLSPQGYRPVTTSLLKFPARALTAAALRMVAILIVLAGVLCGRAGAADDRFTPQEYQTVKAAFLYNFTKFIDWPDGGTAMRPSEFRICIFGSDPFGDAFGALSGKDVKGRNLAIRRVTRIDEVKGCHLLYISASETGRMAGVLKAVRGSPLLTVSDAGGFYEAGGMIALTTEHNRMKFRINNSAAQEAGLRVSSHLLKLATEVE